MPGAGNIVGGEPSLGPADRRLPKRNPNEHEVFMAQLALFAIEVRIASTLEDR
jgi:hypothetical protein